MKAALTIWDGRISPVFDVSREALILTVDSGAVATRAIENIETPMAALKPERLIELGVETLICGAISEPLQHELTTRGVKVIGFVAGEIDEIVESFLAGALPTPALSMPGCGGRQHRFRGGGGRGGGGRGGGGRGGGGRGGGGRGGGGRGGGGRGRGGGGRGGGGRGGGGRGRC